MNWQLCIECVCVFVLFCLLFRSLVGQNLFFLFLIQHCVCGFRNNRRIRTQQVCTGTRGTYCVCFANSENHLLVWTLRPESVSLLSLLLLTVSKASILSQSMAGVASEEKVYTELHHLVGVVIAFDLFIYLYTLLSNSKPQFFPLESFLFFPFHARPLLLFISSMHIFIIFLWSFWKREIELCDSFFYSF